MAVYCTAWTYFGSVGRAASGGVWFLPIYLGPTLAMVLAWIVIRKMIRIAQTYRITSIADFIASRYGKSPLLAGLVTLITVVGIVPYIALQLKAVSSGYALLTRPSDAPLTRALPWWLDGTLYVALALAGFTMIFGTRHLDSAERHEGMVAAMAFESVVKLVAFLAVGVFVTWGLFDGMADLFARAMAVPRAEGAALARAARQAVCVRAVVRAHHAVDALGAASCRASSRSWWSKTSTSGTSGGLPGSFRPTSSLINVFVLPIAHRRVALFSRRAPPDAETFVLSLPLAAGAQGLALGGLCRWPLGGHRHAHRRDDRRLDHGLQRPGDAAAAAASRALRGAAT